ncbi:MAG: serine hydrolase, partial [Bacteroidota bacterium]
MKILKWLGLFLLLAVIGGLWYAQPLLRVGAGYAAKMACSCHYIHGRELADIQATDLDYSALPYATLALDEDAKTVTASFLGMARKIAHFIPGRGCVLRAEENAPLPDPYPNATGRNISEFPTYDTLPAGINMAQVEASVNAAFTPMPQGGTRAVVVLHDGHVVYEQYAEGFDQDTRLLGWSMSKSVTNALIGLAVKAGKLRLEQTQLFEHWTDERSTIALADLLHMNSGLAWNEAYGGTSDATVMLYEQADMAAYAAKQPLEFAPNTVYEYSSGTTNLLTDLLSDNYDERAYYALWRDSLFNELGVYDPYFECDQAGNLVGSSYAWLRARDWAKLGQ